MQHWLAVLVGVPVSVCLSVRVRVLSAAPCAWGLGSAHAPTLLDRFAGGAFEFHFKPPKVHKNNKASDVSATAEVELRDVFFGTTVNVSYSRQEVCPACNGTGAETPKHVVPCPKCFGSGFRISLRKEDDSGIWQQYNTTCHACEGSGIHIEKKCPRCDGNKIVFETKNKTIEVPPGCPDGQTTNFPGEGDLGPGMEPGNLAIRVSVGEHPYFTRQGDDLLCALWPT